MASLKQNSLIHDVPVVSLNTPSSPKVMSNVSQQYWKRVQRLQAADMEVDLTFSQFMNYLEAVQEGEDKLKAQVELDNPGERKLSGSVLESQIGSLNSIGTYYSDDDSWVPGCFRITQKVQERWNRERKERRRNKKKQLKSIDAVNTLPCKLKQINSEPIKFVIHDVGKGMPTLPSPDGSPRKQYLSVPGVVKSSNKNALAQSRQLTCNSADESKYRHVETIPVARTRSRSSEYSRSENKTIDKVSTKKEEIIFPRINSWIARKREALQNAKLKDDEIKNGLLEAYLHHRTGKIAVKTDSKKSQMGQLQNYALPSSKKPPDSLKTRSSAQSSEQKIKLERGLTNTVHLAQISTSQYSDCTNLSERTKAARAAAARRGAIGRVDRSHKRWYFTSSQTPVRLYLHYPEFKQEKYIDGIVGEDGKPLLPASKQSILKGMVYNRQTKSIHPPMPPVARMGRAGRNAKLQRMNTRQNTVSTSKAGLHRRLPVDTSPLRPNGPLRTLSKKISSIAAPSPASSQGGSRMSTKRKLKRQLSTVTAALKLSKGYDR